MSDEITYTSKANRISTQTKTTTPIIGPKKESKQPTTSIPNSFLRKVKFMEKYPQSLRDYIKKCFAQCTDDKSKEIVSTKLMKTINSVSAQGNLNQHNWNAQLLVTPVEKEPTPPPPPPPPKENTNKFPNRSPQAFSSTFLTQQQPQMMQQQPYNFPPTLQPQYGNFQPQYGQGPPPLNQMMPPPPMQPMMQPAFQNNNYQFNNEQNNFNQPYQIKNAPFYQGQTRVTGQNSYQNYEYKPQTDQFRINSNNNNQFQQKNAPFNSNIYEFNTQKRQELTSYAPGQMIPKNNQVQAPIQAPVTQQFISPQGSQSNKQNNNSNNIVNTNNNNANLNQPNFLTKGKKKKKNKKGKNNQQNLNQPFNQINSDDDSISSSTPTVSSSRQRISLMNEDANLTKAIVGTSTSLEKQYLRIAGDQEIDPSFLRPLPVLKESFQYCLNKYSQNNDYEYISDQLRSIRQDLSVQHIEDPFNVEVYETHARLAILNKDWPNFNQSNTQLEILYSKKLGTFQHICEFWKYRIIYLVAIDDIDGLCSFIPRIDNNVMRSNDVQFALKLWKIVQSCEWMKFFSIMKSAEQLVAGVMSLKEKSMRETALSCTCCGFRFLTLADYRTFLCFNEDEDDRLREFLIEYEIPIPEK